MSYHHMDVEGHIQPIDVAAWKKLIGYLAPYRRRLLSMLMLMIVSGILDASIPLFQTYAIRAFVERNTLDGVTRFFWVFSIIIVVQSAIVVLFAVTCIFIEMNLGRDLKRKTFARLQQLSFSYYNDQPVGVLLSRVMSDTDRIGMVMSWGLIDCMWALVYVLSMVIAMLMLSVRLAMPILLMLPIVAGLIAWFQPRILEAGRSVRRSAAQVSGAFNEGITGAKTSKILRMEGKNQSDFSKLTKQLFSHARRSSLLNSLFVPQMMFWGALATAVVLWRGGVLVLENVMDFAVLSAFITYSISLFEPVSQLARHFTDFAMLQANFERVQGLIDAQPDIVDSAEVVEKYGTFLEPRFENFEPLVGDVEFERVSFCYGKALDMVLKDFSLKVNAGTMVAVVGETGAGKSTLVNLLCRFYEPTEGRILIDGRDYKERSQLWLHCNLGYVLQTPHLFSGSIADNIRYGRLEATDEEVVEAAKLVYADRVAASREEGYDFDVGEGGDRLSMGEKQLISFARAVIANPAIFVLDEATSSIDTETERLIQSAAERLLRGRTAFVIAHRLSTIKNADVILVLHEGCVVEQGTHFDLLQKRGTYFDLYTRQYAEQEINSMNTASTEGAPV